MKYLLIAAVLLMAFASSACKTEDYATPTENQQLLGLNTEETEYLERQAEGEDMIAELIDVRARRDLILSDIEGRTVSGFMSWLPIPFLPEPAKEAIALAASTLIFDRPRQNAKKGLKALFKADWKTAALTPIRALGLMHTNNDPLDVLRGAKAAAVARGNVALAKTIQEEIDRASLAVAVAKAS